MPPNKDSGLREWTGSRKPDFSRHALFCHPECYFDSKIPQANKNLLDDMAAANQYLKEVYLPAFNAEFMQPAAVEGPAFVPWIGRQLEDSLCERQERVAGHDNCVSFNNIKLQIPADQHRCHYVKAKVTVLRYLDGRLAILHGPRKIAIFDETGYFYLLLTRKV